MASSTWVRDDEEDEADDTPLSHPGCPILVGGGHFHRGFTVNGGSFVTFDFVGFQGDSKYR